ncbi:hypothetical protein LSAT2_028506 [Lamellibrachia satsuma]|nr:hypothetical protein LSAT2_028506 [Lamellibrachia satsuma]
MRTFVLGMFALAVFSCVVRSFEIRRDFRFTPDRHSFAAKGGAARLLRQTQSDKEKLKRYLEMRMLPRSEASKTTDDDILPALEDLQDPSLQESKRQSRSGAQICIWKGCATTGGDGTAEAARFGTGGKGRGQGEKEESRGGENDESRGCETEENRGGENKESSGNERDKAGKMEKDGKRKNVQQKEDK